MCFLSHSACWALLADDDNGLGSTSYTQGCALGRYENWPQRWLWTVILASASMVTPNRT